MFKKSIFVISIMFTVAACGGGGGSSGGEITTATGQFKDSNTIGLNYVSGGQSGVTGADGSFTYEVGKTVTFSVGGVTIGTSDGKSIITPVDLVSGGSSNLVEVLNIVSFLMMLDDDGDPSNGINISPLIQPFAENWAQVDFTLADLFPALDSIISDAASADSGDHYFPSIDNATNHLEETLRCSYAGAYKGTFSGDDNGTFGFLVDALNGTVRGVAYSIPSGQHMIFSGTGGTAISYDQNVTFVTGPTNTGAIFSGQFTSVNEMSGTWQESLDSGSFSGSRIGGATDALYRFTGNYTGEDYGLFSFDVDSSSKVTGIAYSVEYDELYTLSGSVSGTSLSATTSEGAVITGLLNTADGSLSGTWTNNVDGLSGAFSGGGCRLN